MKVRIEYEPGENPLEADALLIKALTHNQLGKVHKEDFHDPAPREVYNAMITEHDIMFAKMLKEIEDVLEEDVKGGNSSGYL